MRITEALRYVVAGEDGEAEENALWIAALLAILCDTHPISRRPHRVTGWFEQVPTARNSSPSPPLDLRLSWAIQLFASIQRWEMVGMWNRMDIIPSPTTPSLGNTDFVHSSTLNTWGVCFFFLHTHLTFKLETV